MSPIDRPRQFHLMLSDREFSQLQTLAKAVGLTASDFIRTRAILAGGEVPQNLQQHRGSIEIRLDMIKADIARIETGKNKQERQRAATDARSALAHLGWHINAILRAAGADALPELEPAAPPQREHVRQK